MFHHLTAKVLLDNKRKAPRLGTWGLFLWAEVNPRLINGLKLPTSIMFCSQLGNRCLHVFPHFILDMHQPLTPNFSPICWFVRPLLIRSCISITSFSVRMEDPDSSPFDVLPFLHLSSMFSKFVATNKCSGFTQLRLSQVWQTHKPSGTGP